MIKLENYETMGWEQAIRGARNPMNSWAKMDSVFTRSVVDGKIESFRLGPNDHKLLMKLSKAGSDHGKYLRMIAVYVDITAPLYWWKEFDTYKVGTVANSCSTMHKIHDKEFVINDFSHGKLYDKARRNLLSTIDILNDYRQDFIETKDKNYWWQMIQLLPSSYNQKRTVMLNYEVLKNIYRARKAHKLDEWIEFCDWIKRLPYSELITGEEK